MIVKALSIGISESRSQQLQQRQNQQVILDLCIC